MSGSEGLKERESNERGYALNVDLKPKVCNYENLVSYLFMLESSGIKPSSRI